MKITLFTVENATKLARELSPKLEQLVKLNAEIDGIDARMDVLALALSGASSDNPDAVEAQRLGTRRSELAAQIRAGLEHIHSRGPVVKDLAMGLIDFYSLAGDRLVFLCWKLGEAEVAHWHTLDGGFATRKTLDKSPLED